MDPCLELVYRGRCRQRWSALQRAVAAPLRVLAFHADTPQDRIERAAGRELSDLSGRAFRALTNFPADAFTVRALDSARDALGRGEADGTFPRHELEQIVGTFSANGAPETGRPLREELGAWIDRHKAFERRLRWLMDPEVTRRELHSLDPIDDADQLWCFVKYDFRPEFLYSAWGNAIERIAQSEAVATFFHATGKAENIPLKRTEDTLVHYYYVFNWGIDSYHGRKAIESMNRIHGRVFIPNDGMKYVLLNAAFTVLDAFDAVGHRPLAAVERLGYFHAQIAMGQAMRIQGLTHSWEEMRAWFDGLNRALSAYAPQKRRMWDSIEDNFDRDARVPGFASRFRKVLETAAMDDTYRSALGVEAPSAQKIARAKRILRFFVRMRALLPKDPYIESLQNFVSYPNGVDIEHAGERARSERLPAACPFASRAMREKIEPEIPPILHSGEAPAVELRTIAWDEVRRHRTEDDLWVVFGGHVYDVSAFARNHPGGLQILLKSNGRDMTKAFEKAGHSDLTKVFALNFRIGKIEAAPSPAVKPPRALADAHVQLN